MKKFLVALFVALGLLAGCSSGKPAIAVSASSSASTVVAGGTAQITATLTNDSSGQGITWAVTCSATPCGSVSPTSSTSSPYTTTYTAPAAAPASDLTVTITATSVTDSSKSGTVNITVPAITVSVAPSTPQTVDANSSKQFTATVANDPANGGVTWAVSCNVASCGKVSPTSTASGTATTYSAPTTPPTSDLVVTLTATSATDGSKTASATITVPAVTVSVSPSAPTVEAGQTQGFTATVSNTSNSSVTWVLYNGAVPCSPTCGTLSSTTSNPVTYSAPATPPSSSLTLTLTATSAADATKSASATITVPALSVSVSPPTATVEATQTQQITATVSNFSGNTGVNWTVTCGVASCGTLSASSTASGTATTYTAPSTPPASDLTVTVKATSKDDATKSASATITVPAISVSIAPPAPSVVISTTQDFTATVGGDAANKGVTWSYSWNGSPCTVTTTCGSLTSPTTFGVTYLAPTVVPSPATVTLTATSVTDTSKSASATITILATAACGTGSEGLLNGHYAFLLKGFDSSGNPALVIGDITADGSGAISAGLMDMNLNSGTLLGKSVTGTYSVGSDHRGCMALTVSGGSPGTQNYRFTLGGITSGVASHGQMIDFDAGGPFTTGVIRKQDTSAFTTASLAGNFAFGGTSLQNSSAGGGKAGIAGVWNLSGAAGEVTGGEVDVNKNGLLDQNVANTVWPNSAISIDSGGSYVVYTTGRGGLSFTPHGAASAVDTVIYVIDADDFFFMSQGSQTSNITTAGTAMKQSGSFSNASLTGTGVYYTSSVSGTPGGTRAQIGIITAAGAAGTYTLSAYANDDGAFSSQSGVSANFTVDSTGRTLFSGSNAGNHPPVLYLVNTTEGFLLGGNTGVDSGFLEPQTGGPVYTAASISGTYSYGAIDPNDPSVPFLSGFVTFDGSSAYTGTNDENTPSGGLFGDNNFGSSYSTDSNGLVLTPPNCSISASATSCSIMFLIISPTEFVSISTDTSDKDPVILFGEQ